MRRRSCRTRRGAPLARRLPRNALEHRQRAREQGAIAGGEGGERCDERGDAALTPVVEELGPARGGADAHDASVGRVDQALDELPRLQHPDQPRDRRRPHLLGAGEITEGDGAAEDDDGKGGELGSGEAGGIIFAAKAAEEMKRRGVEAIGEAGGVHACGGEGENPYY